MTRPDTGVAAAHAPAATTRVDPDFAHSILGDLYSYRRKRLAVAWLFWASFGWMGAHRFYMERTGTGLLQMLTGGGALLWWIADVFRVTGWVRDHNAEQTRRQQAGEPPLELDFMPRRAVDVLDQPPEWTVRWQSRGRAWRTMRLVGDVLVLMVAGSTLGAVAGMEGGTEAVFAVIALIGVTLLGGQAAWLGDVPIARALVAWSHRLRLFYYFNRPGTPPGLLIRAATALVTAPFRRRDRAETRLYLELGAVFTLVFLAAYIVEDVLAPLFGQGVGALSPIRLVGVWAQEVTLTFLFTYAFAAPVGAVLTLYLLTRRTHTLPRLLGALTLLFIALGAGIL